MLHVCWAFKRFIINFPLHKNADQKKIIKCIQQLEKDNQYIKYEDKIGGIGTNLTLSFIIKDDTLIISWSHLYYDMYSITFVLSKIDDIYHDKIKTFMFQYYKHNLYEFIYDDIHFFKNIKHICKNALHFHNCDKKKYIKISKKKLQSPVSSTEIFKHILNELNIDVMLFLVTSVLYGNNVSFILSLTSSVNSIPSNQAKTNVPKMSTNLFSS